MTKVSFQAKLFLLASLAVAFPDGWTALFGFGVVNIALTLVWVAILLVAIFVLRWRAWPLIFGAPFALLLPSIAFSLILLDAGCRSRPYFMDCL